MEILYNEDLTNANIKFENDITDEVKKDLVEAGWLYSPSKKVWYPKVLSEENVEFARKIEQTYYSKNIINNTVSMMDLLKDVLNKIDNQSVKLEELSERINKIEQDRTVLNNLTDESTWNRLETFFEGITSKIDSVKNYSFAEIKNYVEARYSNASMHNIGVDENRVYINAITRMLTDNHNYFHINENEFNRYGIDVENYDESILDLDEIIAENILSGNIKSFDEIDKFAEKESLVLKNEILRDFTKKYNVDSYVIDVLENGLLWMENGAETQEEKNFIFIAKNTEELFDIDNAEKAIIARKVLNYISAHHDDHFDIDSEFYINSDIVSNFVKEKIDRYIPINEREEITNVFDKKVKNYLSFINDTNSKEIEDSIKFDIQNIFNELDPSPIIEEIKLYQDPKKTGKINILVQYNTDSDIREDSLFNAISEEELSYEGLPVDVNPIRPDISGTITEYLAHLESIGIETETNIQDKDKFSKTLPENKPYIDYFVTDNIEFENELYSNLTVDEAVAKYKEMISDDPFGFIPSIGINLHDGSVFELKEGESGVRVFAGTRIEDVPADIKHFRKSPEYIQGMKDLAQKLEEAGIPVENKEEFLAKYPEEYKVNGLTFKAYYDSPNTRDIVHNVADTENPEKQKEAIQTIADYLINENVVNEGDILLPAPSHSGDAEYTKEIAQIIADKTGSTVLDILKAYPHETLYAQKKSGNKELDVSMYLNGEIPEGKKVFFVDNVISTGTTFNEAKRLIDGITPLVYSVATQAVITFDGKNYNVSRPGTKIARELSWDELKNFFAGHDNGSFDSVRDTVISEKHETEGMEKEETVGILLFDKLSWGNYSNDNIDINEEFNSQILEEKWTFIEKLEAGIVDGNISSFENAQIMLNDMLLKSELYKETSEILKQKMETKQIEEMNTNFILEKLNKAGIEVVTDKDEFERILNQKEDIQKMSSLFSKIDCGIVEKWQIEEAKDVGLDLTNYKHQITNEFIFHVIKYHGNQITEASRGNIAITKDDLKSINEIITSADRVIYGVTKTEKVAGKLIDRQRIIYAKNQPDGTSLYFEEVLEGKKNKRLRGKTFFKRNGSIDDKTLLTILGNNKKKYNIENAIIKAHPDVAISSLSQPKNVDVAAVSTVSELDKSISDFVDKSITDYKNSRFQSFTLNSITYSFVHNGKMYLNPEFMTSEGAVHEYTHLWDAYTQKTNPDLWERGKEVFKQTYLWDEVKNDSNYQDIAEDEDLLLSECHARITGKIASEILEKIARENGNDISNEAIDWDKEVFEYCQNEMGFANKDFSDFISMTIKDLINEKNIQLETIDELKEGIVNKESIPHKPRIFTFSPFGYEGTLVEVETDLRRGIPAYDIVGISDAAVKETRERIRSAVSNSGLEMPAERIFQCLSPADLKKEGLSETLALAVAVLNEKEPYNSEDLLIMGDLELSGNIRPARSVFSAVTNAKANGITKVIVSEFNKKEAMLVEGVEVLAVKSLSELNTKLINNYPFEKIEIKESSVNSKVEFDEEKINNIISTINLDGHYDTARAIEIAIAGKHNILLSGRPGSGKTMLPQILISALTPKLTDNESQSTTRLYSIAGLLSPQDGLKKDSPFREPHQTASIEGLCGGGSLCHPGEISLAHNGTLFLDEAAEFRSSALQILRVPLESKSITLSRAGRSTVFPANFQLAMTTNPCPCGNFGSADKICLCSSKSIEMYWKKFSDPLIDRVEIKQNVQKNNDDKRHISITEMKEHIENAISIQRENGVYNRELSPIDISNKCKLNEECSTYFNSLDNYSERSKSNMLKVALTIANMDKRREIAINDLREAVELVAPIFEKPNTFKYQPIENVNLFAKEDVKLFNMKNSDLNVNAEKEYSGSWIPQHNAKVMKRGIEENKAPFLPDSSGNINAEAIYNGATGYCLPAGRLVPVQFAKMENNFSSNIVVPHSTVSALENNIKENSRGVFYNFKDENGYYHTASLYFPEQTENPEKIISATKDKIQQMDNLKDIYIAIASSEPKEYLGNYIASCRSGMKLSVEPEIAEDFKKKVMPILDNEIKNSEDRDKNIQSLSSLFYESDKRSTEILRTLNQEFNAPSSVKQQKNIEHTR